MVFAVEVTGQRRMKTDNGGHHVPIQLRGAVLDERISGQLMAFFQYHAGLWNLTGHFIGKGNDNRFAHSLMGDDNVLDFPGVYLKKSAA